jgi:hypothetical protein
MIAPYVVYSVGVILWFPFGCRCENFFQKPS